MLSKAERNGQVCLYWHMTWSHITQTPKTQQRKNKDLIIEFSQAARYGTNVQKFIFPYTNNNLMPGEVPHARNLSTQESEAAALDLCGGQLWTHSEF